MVLIIQAPAKKQKLNDGNWRKWRDEHRCLPISAEVSMSSISKLSIAPEKSNFPPPLPLASSGFYSRLLSTPSASLASRSTKNKELNKRFVSTIIIDISIFSDWKPLQTYANSGPYNSMQHEKHVQDWISDNLKAYSNMHCVNYWRRLKTVQTEELALLHLPSFHFSNCEIESNTMEMVLNLFCVNQRMKESIAAAVHRNTHCRKHCASCNVSESDGIQCILGELIFIASRRLSFWQ